MATIQKSLRIEEWIHDEIEKIRKDSSVSYAEVVNTLLEAELNKMGFTKAEWRKRKLGLRNINNEEGDSRRAQ